jgi:hypothetical protein
MVIINVSNGMLERGYCTNASWTRFDRQQLRAESQSSA